MTESSESFFQQEYVGYAVVFVIALIVISVLALVILVQSKRIRELKEPKYGFLGKPLNAFFAVAVLVGGSSLYYYAANRAPVEDVQVSADKQIDLSVHVEPVNPGINEYEFKVIPYLDGEEWGKESETFDVYWTISGTDSITKIEPDLSSSNTGGFLQTLSSGLHNISVDVFVGNDSAEKTITVMVP